MPASTKRRTPSCRWASVNSGHSPMEPQYTTALMPVWMSLAAVLTNSSKSGWPEASQGVIRAGMQPWKMLDVVFFMRLSDFRQQNEGIRMFLVFLAIEVCSFLHGCD
jgi:hypothetical protein